MKSFTLPGFAAHCAKLALKLDHAEHTGLEKAARIVERESKALIGTYDAGWPALQPETVARKAGGDTPLHETGKLEGSISHTVGHHEAAVGTNEQTGVWHELGTAKAPPRSFLMSAAVRKEAEVVEALGSGVAKALTQA